MATASPFYTPITADAIGDNLREQQANAPAQPVETQPTTAEPKAGFLESSINRMVDTGVNPLEAGAQEVLARNITPSSEKKGFLTKLKEDAIALGAGIPIALSHPINTLKSLVVGGEEGEGVGTRLKKGALVQSLADVFRPSYYKEHPGLAAFNTGTWIATIFSFGLSKVIGGMIKTGMETAVKESAATVGLKSAETAAEAAMKTVLRRATQQAIKTGDTAIIAEATKASLLKQGFEAAAAERISASVTETMAKQIAENAGKIKIWSTGAHPLKTTTELFSNVSAPVRKALFGTPAETAVAKIYGADIVRSNPAGFLEIEDWAGKQAIQRGLKNTIDNRQAIMNEWSSTIGEWSLLSPEERIAYHRNYIRASDLAQKVGQITGDIIVPTKFLSPKYAELIKQTINEAPAEESVIAILDDLEAIYGNDIGLHRQQLERVVRDNPTREALTGGIDALSKRHTLSYAKLPEINKLVKQLEDETGYKLIEAPKGKEIVFATGEAVPRQKAATLQVGITSAQQQNPIVAQTILEGEKLYQAGKVDAGLAKLQEATQITKDELNLALHDGVSTVSRLETDTHGLYFGTPEPSYWLRLRTGNVDETLGSLAWFAKRNQQESFITAKKLADVATEGSWGIKIKFQAALQNADVLKIEQIANDAGIGLTLNKGTGEAIAYNIQQWDNLSPEQFVETAGKIKDALKSSGYKLKFSVDKYEIGVYTKDIYDQLISKSTAKERGAIGVGTEQAGVVGGGAVAGGGEPGRITGGLPAESPEIIGAKTKLGKLIERFGLSPTGGVEGNLEYFYQDQFTQNAMKELAPKYGEAIKIKGRQVPLEKLYNYLNSRRKAISEAEYGFIKTRFTVSDISKGDLIRLGVDKEVAADIAKVIRSSLDIPFAETGLAEGVVNLMRRRVPGFNTFINTKFETHFNLNPFYAMRYWFKTQLLKAMNLGKVSVTFGEALDGRIIRTIEKLPYMKNITAPAVTLGDIKLMSEEVLYRMNRNIVDFASNPELITLEKAADIGKSIQSRNVFMRGVGYNIPYDATSFAKEVAAKYGMTLEDALGYSLKNGVKSYWNPEVFNIIKDTTQAVFHYEPGILTSPLMKTLNIIWFPLRFETKVMMQTSRWLANLSPLSRLAVTTDWINFSNWAQTSDGLAWRKKNQGMWVSTLRYLLPYESIGKTIGNALGGKLFGGNTGMIGGLPFGWLINIMQDLAILPEDVQTNPVTGQIVKKSVPKKLASLATASIALEDLCIHILPSIPAYTLLGGNVTPWNRIIRDWIRGGLSAVKAEVTGEEPKREKRKLERSFKTVPTTYMRF